MARRAAILSISTFLCLLHTYDAFQQGVLFPTKSFAQKTAASSVRVGCASLPPSLSATAGPVQSSSFVKFTTQKRPLARRMSSASAEKPEKPKTNLVLLAVYFAAWYALNVGYNIANKQVLNVFPLYATVAAAQLLAAWIWLLPQWAVGIRSVPKPSPSNMAALQKISLLHGFGYLVTVLSLSLGSVSFVHVVKAAEPVFAAVLSALFAGAVLALPVYLSLIPVCAGVALASAGELSFTWGCFGAAMLSNLLFASRAVFSKMAMDGSDRGENMDPANTYAVVTMLAALLCVPTALLLEGATVKGAWAAAIATPGMTEAKLAATLALSGWFHYTNNEFAYKVLGLVSPVAQAVGNTAKRVVILVASSLAFATPMTPLGVAGSAIALAGVLGYSLVQQAEQEKVRAKAAKKTTSE